MFMERLKPGSMILQFVNLIMILLGMGALQWLIVLMDQGIMQCSNLWVYIRRFECRIRITIH